MEAVAKNGTGLIRGPRRCRLKPADLKVRTLSFKEAADRSGQFPVRTLPRSGHSPNPDTPPIRTRSRSGHFPHPDTFRVRTHRRDGIETGRGPPRKPTPPQPAGAACGRPRSEGRTGVQGRAPGLEGIGECWDTTPPFLGRLWIT